METKRGIFIIVTSILLLILPLVSSDIIINTQPSATYNLGSIVTIPVTLKTTAGVSGNFLMDLLCGSSDINFYKNGVILSAGQQEDIQSSLLLSNTVIGNITGNCVIKAMIGSEYVITNDFDISNAIIINSNFSKTEFNPGDNLSLKGSAIRQDQTPANGYVETDVLNGNSSVISQESTVSSGNFSVNLNLPPNLAAGNYVVRIRVYEKDSLGGITNNGFIDQKIKVDQVPANLEIIFENSTVTPGTNLSVKAILHDQTGVSINSQTFLTVKDNNNKILDQEEIPTNQFLQYSIPYDTPPATWTVVAVSEKDKFRNNFWNI